MAVLVTGIGYIGAQLVTDLLAQGEEVVAVDNFFSTDVAAVERLVEHPSCHLIRGHYGDRRVLSAAFRHRPISHVYCLAAQASAHAKAASPRYTEVSNLLAPRQLLDAMRRHGVRSIVYGSSLHIYGGATPATSEDAAYGAFRDLSHLSKVYVEKLLEMYAGLHGLRCLSVRLGIVYGLSPVMKSDYRFMTAPNKFSLQLVRGEPIVLNPGADRSLGFVHVADASAALQAIAGHNGFEGYTPVNVATEWASVATVASIAGRLAFDRGLLSKCDDSEPATEPGVGPRLAETGFRAKQVMAADLGAVMDYFRACDRVAPAEQAQANVDLPTMVQA